MKLQFAWLGGILLAITSCRTPQHPTHQDDQKITVQLLQTNDVYEIAPLEGGKVGGMARVAQLKKELLARNKNTLSILSGDFLNPSVIGTLKYDNERVQGRQMVEVMNAAGIDLVTFGNHEFDLKEADLLKRIDESKFSWIAANVWHISNGNRQRFQQRGTPLPAYKFYTFDDADGTQIRVGFIAVCIGSNAPNYVTFDDVFATARQTYDHIKDSVDFVIALTHIDIADDLTLAKNLPEVKLFIGGHDHNNMKHQVGDSWVTKADANAKTAYIHTLHYDKKTKQLRIESTLREVNTQIANEPATQTIVERWVKIANQSFGEQGFNPDEIVLKMPFALDAREQTVRYKPSLAANWVAQSVRFAAPESQGAFANTGSIRIDDVLVGSLSQYDVIRMLPFGGKIVEIDIKGRLLSQILEIGTVANRGKGGYLALDNLRFDNGKAYIGNQAVEPEKSYRIATTEFMLAGKESNLEFLTASHPDIIKVYPTPAQASDLRNDVRQAIIAYFRTLRPAADACSMMQCPQGTICKNGVCQ